MEVRTMEINPPKTGIYDAVDRFRHRNNWGCLVWFLILILVAAGVVLWVGKYYIFGR